MKTLIKPYSFVDFFEQDWKSWKNKRLVDAYRNVHRLVVSEMAAFAGNQTKIPILWDENDYRFLSQFPPFLWQQALVWRYNEGLLEASRLREEDPDHSLDVIPSTRDTLVFKHGPKKYIFKDVWTGFKELFKRLETPIKNHAAHTAPGISDGPGLMDIDPNETDESSPRHRKNYSHGLMDYDLSGPVLQTDDMIDSIPPEVLAKKLPPDTPPTDENIAALRERMKKNKQHSFAGMGVLQPGPAASRLLNTWIYAQGLGLLGKPEEYVDPVTGEKQKPVEGAPSTVNGHWASHAGKDDGRGRGPQPLQVPMIKRKLNMRVEDAEGRTEHESGAEKIAGKHAEAQRKLAAVNAAIEQRRLESRAPTAAQLRDQAKFQGQVQQYEGELERLRGLNTGQQEVEMPVLMPGAALPRLTGEFKLTDEQKRILAARSGKTEEGAEGGIGQVYNLLQNWDILSDEQRDHLVKNKRELIHLAAAQFGGVGHGDDIWSQLGQFYVVGGHSPNANVRKIVALPADKKEEIIEKYYKQLLWGQKQFSDSPIEDGTHDNIGYFIRWAKNGKKLPAEVIDMLSSIKVDLAQVCAALLAMNLNNPELGVYDPELGLTGVSPDTPADKLNHGRYNYAFNFARDISQAALAGMASRRARQKGHTVGTVSHSAETGADGGSMSDVLAAGGPRASEKAGDAAAQKAWWTKRHHLDPTSSDEYEKPEGGTDEPIARLTWKIPEVKHEVSKLFQTKRALIAKNASTLTGVVDKAIQDIESVPEEKSEIELHNEKMPANLRADFDKQWEAGMQGLVKGTPFSPPQYLPPTEMQAGVGSGGGEIVPSEFELSLDVFIAKGEPKEQVKLLAQIWNKDGAARWAVPLLLATSRQEGQQMTRRQAAEAAKEAGVTASLGDYGKKAVPSEGHAEFDDEMEEFFTQLAKGKILPTPFYDAEEGGVDFDPQNKSSLGMFPHQGGKPDARYLVHWIEEIWDEEGAKKHAVPMYIAIGKRNGKDWSQRQAVDDIIQHGGIVPIQAEPDQVAGQGQQPTAAPRPDTIPLRPDQPQQGAAPAAAATDVSALLADPVTNYDQLRTRKEELRPYKAQLQQYLAGLTQRMRSGGQPLSPQELRVKVGLGVLVNQL